MFIIVIGTRAAGKSSIIDYLVDHRDFKHMRLVRGNPVFGLSAPALNQHNSSRYGDHGVLPAAQTHGVADVLANLQSEPCPDSDPISACSQVLMMSSSPSTRGENILEVDSTLGFSESRSLLEHVTRHWRDNFVTEDITSRELLEPFLKRPFVLLVSVDAPALVRFRRHQKRDIDVTLERFVADDDRIAFGQDSDHITSSYLFASYHLCHVHVINSFPTLIDLNQHLHGLNLLNPDRLRPSWDTYFMKLANLASHRSNCMKRRVGAILVSKDHTIIATGYNGTPRNVRNCNDGGCKRCNEGGPPIEGFEECLCIHAEENALLEAGRERVGKGTIMYCNTCPCLKCTIKIVQNGVSEVVYFYSYKMDESAKRVFKEAGVKIRQHSLPR